MADDPDKRDEEQDDPHVLVPGRDLVVVDRVEPDDVAGRVSRGPLLELHGLLQLLLGDLRVGELQALA